MKDGVESSTRKSQTRFQIILVSSSAEPRVTLEFPRLDFLRFPRLGLKSIIFLLIAD